MISTAIFDLGASLKFRYPVKQSQWIGFRERERSWNISLTSNREAKTSRESKRRSKGVWVIIYPDRSNAAFKMDRIRRRLPWGTNKQIAISIKINESHWLGLHCLLSFWMNGFH